MDLSKHRIRLSDAEHVRRLREELWFARHTIMDLMPDDLRELLLSFARCTNRREAWGWADTLALEISAKPFTFRTMSERCWVTEASALSAEG
jgi:hypothetical protein